MNSSGKNPSKSDCVTSLQEDNNPRREKWGNSARNREMGDLKSGNVFPKVPKGRLQCAIDGTSCNVHHFFQEENVSFCKSYVCTNVKRTCICM